MKSTTWLVILTFATLFGFGCGSDDFSIQKIEQLLTYVRTPGNQIIFEVEIVP